MEALGAQLNALAGTGKTGDADYRVASAGYFAALNIPLDSRPVFPGSRTARTRPMRP